MEEQEIIRLIREKDERGAGELLKNYAPLIRYIIAPILPNEEDLEECLFEVAMRVWDKIDMYDSSRGKWNTWLTALTRNTALNIARQKRNENNTGELSPEYLSSEPSLEETVIEQERKAVLQKTIKGLPIQSQVLFYRKYYYLQSTAQIASELGMTERAVEGKLYRLKKKLQNLMGGELFE
ncbi:MAG TPA: sigma-70 family RNA polymerase sigma factor [Clostridia bacterium]|nr:sigma-70 family RNA polymerase sigma factor [Clostridia bacterium]